MKWKEPAIRLLSKPPDVSLLRMMTLKNKIAGLFILFMLCSAAGQAQQKKYSFNFKDAALERVIKDLAAQSGTNILYNPVILPGQLRITGVFKNLTLKQALDTFLIQTQINYRFYKGDIVLCKKNEEVKETHQPIIPKSQKKDVIHEVVTDTVTYTVLAYDTIVTKLAEYVKVPVFDTVRVKVYDTIRIRQNVPVPVTIYRPGRSAVIAGLSISQSALFSSIQVVDTSRQFAGAVKSSLKDRKSDGFGLSFIYKGTKWMVETGIYFSTHRYSFNYALQTRSFESVIDTLDRYFTNINGSDTSWVYVTRESQLERLTEKKYMSDFSYRFIAVPLLVGYTSTARNFTFEFKGGVLCNFYVGSTGFYLKTSANSNSAVEDIKAPHSSVSLGLMGAVAIDYFLNKHIHIFGQPSFSWDVLSMAASDVQYKTTALQIGVLAGIRYYF